jgi:integrase
MSDPSIPAAASQLFNAAKSHLRTHILPMLGNSRLDQIGPEVQQTFVTRISPKVARKTLLNILGTLSAILTKAKEWKYICEPVHIHSLALPTNAGGARARFFAVDQVRAIIAATAEPWTTFFTLAAMTGMRAGELLGLQITDLDFERRLIQVWRSAWYGKAQSPKTARSVRTVPMPESRETIAHRRRTMLSSIGCGRFSMR